MKATSRATEACAGLVIHLVRLGWGGDQKGVLELLNRLDELPDKPGAHNPDEPSRRAFFADLAYMLTEVLSGRNAGRWRPDREEGRGSRENSSRRLPLSRPAPKGEAAGPAAEAALPAPRPSSKGVESAVRIHLDGSKVLLDGRSVPLDMTEESRGAAICLLGHLLAAAGDWRSSTDLNEMEVNGPCKLHTEVRWDRIRKSLPACLLDLTESNRRKGYRLSHSAWHK